MTKFLIVLFAVLILIVAAFSLRSDDSKFVGYESIDYQLNGKSYKLLVADTTAKRTKGLMNVDKLNDYDGMIFIFPDKKIRGFWNKNTISDLTIYWIDGDKVIGLSDLPSIKVTKNIYTVYSPSEVDKVIELMSKK